MKGSRPLTDEEIQRVSHSFQGQHAVRNRALFILGIRTGFRISELLSLRVSDVYQYGQVTDRVTVQKRHMKGKPESRTILLHAEAKAALDALIQELSRQRHAKPDHPLFRSNKGRNCPLTRIQAWNILNTAFQEHGLMGQLGTHCMRKTFANRMYDRLGHDLFKTQKASGHRNINDTISYLSFRQDEIDAAILA